MSRTDITAINAKTVSINGVPIAGSDAPVGLVTTFDQLDADAVLALNGSVVQGTFAPGMQFTNFNNVNVLSGVSLGDIVKYGSASTPASGASTGPMYPFPAGGGAPTPTPTPSVALTLNSTTDTATARNFSGQPHRLFSGNFGGRRVFDAAGVLSESQFLYGYHAPRRWWQTPDGPTHTTTGEGFTNTGLTTHSDPQFLWLGNFGQRDASDATPQQATLVKVTIDGAYVSEIPLYTMSFAGTLFKAMQGIARDTLTNNIYVTDNNTRICIVTEAGGIVGVVTPNGAGSGPCNGLAYDATRDLLWCSGGTVLYSISKTTGTVVTSYTITDIAIDHIVHDPDKDILWCSDGANGEGPHRAVAINPATGLEINRMIFPTINAIEGITIHKASPSSPPMFLANHDGRYHAVDNAVPPSNTVNFFGYASGPNPITSEWPRAYDPVNANALLGYPIEKAQSSIIGGQNFATSPWSNTLGTSVADVAVGPNGYRLEADRFTPAMATVSQSSYNSSTPTTNTAAGFPASGSRVTMSLFVKPETAATKFWMADRTNTAGGTGVTFECSGSGGIVGKSPPVIDAGCEPVGNGEYYCWFTYVRTGTNSISVVRGPGTATHPAGAAFPSAIWAGTEGFQMWGQQWGIGESPASSLINIGAFSGNSFVMPADAPSAPASVWDWSPTINTIMIAGVTARSRPASAQVLLQLDDGSEANRIRVFRDASNVVHLVVTVAGVAVADLNMGVVANKTAMRIGIRFKDGVYAASLNGGAIVTGPASLPAITTLRPGNGFSGDQWCGALKTLSIAPVDASDAVLQV